MIWCIRDCLRYIFSWRLEENWMKKYMKWNRSNDSSHRITSIRFFVLFANC